MKIPTTKELIDKLGWTAAINELKVILYRLSESIGNTSFISLLDTPKSYEGQAGKIAVVNDDEDGLEFINNSAGGSQTLRQTTALGNQTPGSIEFLDDDDNVKGAISKNGAIFENDNGSIMGINTTNDPSITSITMANANGNTVVLGVDENDTGSLLIIRYPNPSIGTDFRLPITVNGNMADVEGNINMVDVANNFANDAAAAVGNIQVGQLYHTAGVVKIRLT